MNHTFISMFLGCVYMLEDNHLLTTPLNTDNTFDNNTDNWVVVDKSDFQEGSDELVHVEWVISHLRVKNEGLFATN